MSKRAKSSPADFISRRIAGLRTMLIQTPTCVSPRSRARFMVLVCMILSSWVSSDHRPIASVLYHGHTTIGKAKKV